MFPTGIFVKADPVLLAGVLPEALLVHGPPRLAVDTVLRDPHPKDWAILRMDRWSEEWCLIGIDGPENLTSLLVDCLVRLKDLTEFVTCRFEPEAGEFSYAFFREVRPLETFEGSGPAAETVNFTSELRRVPIQQLLRASEFMTNAMEQFGIASGNRETSVPMEVGFYVRLPGKDTFWQKLLGTASPR